MPSSVISFDLQLCVFAKALWEEGDAKATLGNTLGGLAHFVPGLRGDLKGAWRLYRAWNKAEPEARAPPYTMIMAQAMAGFMLHLGLPRVALMEMFFGCSHPW